MRSFHPGQRQEHVRLNERVDGLFRELLRIADAVSSNWSLLKLLILKFASECLHRRHPTSKPLVVRWRWEYSRTDCTWWTGPPSLQWSESSSRLWFSDFLHENSIDSLLQSVLPNERSRNGRNWKSALRPAGSELSAFLWSRKWARKPEEWLRCYLDNW